MSDVKRSGGCLGVVMVGLVLGFLALIFYRATEMIGFMEKADRVNHLGEPVDSGSTTMEDQLTKAQETGRKITEIRVEGGAVPVDGPWVIKEVGYDVVILEGSAGTMTLRIEKIVLIVVAPEEPKKAAEQSVEK